MAADVQGEDGCLRANRAYPDVPGGSLTSRAADSTCEDVTRYSNELTGVRSRQATPLQCTGLLGRVAEVSLNLASAIIRLAVGQPQPHDGDDHRETRSTAFSTVQAEYVRLEEAIVSLRKAAQTAKMEQMSVPSLGRSTGCANSTR